MGISVAGDRIKILSILEEKQLKLNRAYDSLKKIVEGEEKRINKHIYTWIGTFLLGYFGVDRFMRGQAGYGFLKILIDWVGIWAIIDFVIALSKYGEYENDFVFINGKWK